MCRAAIQKAKRRVHYSVFNSFFWSLGARRSFAKKKKKKSLKIRKSQGTKNRQMVMRRKAGERGGPIKKKTLYVCLLRGEKHIYIYIFVFRPSSRPNQPRRF